MSSDFEEWARPVLLQMATDVAVLKTSHSDHLAQHKEALDAARFAKQLRQTHLLSIAGLVTSVIVGFGGVAFGLLFR